jgi:hypothetical protein
MNCMTAREHLPLLLYGDLQPPEAAALEAHLARCEACAAERAALAHVRQALTTVPPPGQVEVDVRRLYAELQQAAERRARRWKWAAVLVAASLAGLVFFTLVARLELRVEPDQLVLRWGQPSLPEQPQAPAPVEPVTVGINQADLQAPRRTGDQVVVLSKLIHTLAGDTANRDETHEREIARLKREFNDLQRQIDRRFQDTEKDLRTLYKWQFVRNDKGELQ